MILVKDLLDVCMYPYHFIEVLDGGTKKKIDTSKQNCQKILNREVKSFDCYDDTLILYLRCNV